MLYIISTPIGNLSDITLRAIEILKNVDIIAAEDTRRTRTLLSHHCIRYRELISFNENNEKRKIPWLLDHMASGKSVAVVSDSGTPCISDPGYRISNLAAERGINVIPVPGPSAVLAALVASGMPTDSFTFIGFLPKTSGKRRKAVERIRSSKETVIAYESPHRIEKTLSVMAELMPEKRICIAREMTKRFEEFLRGTPSEIVKKLGSRKLKGEIVLVI